MPNADHDYKTAMELAQSYSPQKERDYAWVVDHANRQFEQASACVDAIDAKAAGVINYLGAFGGLAAISAVQQAGSETPWLATLLIPSIIAAASGIALCATALRPRSHAYPPNPERAMRYAEAYEPEIAPMRFALMTWAATERLKAVQSMKARLVGAAYWALTVAVGLLVAPCAAILFAQ